MFCEFGETGPEGGARYELVMLTENIHNEESPLCIHQCSEYGYSRSSLQCSLMNLVSVFQISNFRRTPNSLLGRVRWIGLT